jgi:hypothetical protein
MSMASVAEPKPRLQQIDPLTAARMSGAEREGNHYREGRCFNCGHKALKIQRGDDGRTMLWCYRCNDFDAIAAVLRGMGYSTTDQRFEPRRPSKAKIAVNASWETSPAIEALTKTEMRVDAIIAAVRPNSDGLRLITVREIQARMASPRLVKNALRVLKAIGRWKAAKVKFVAPGGRLFIRSGYQEGNWRDRYNPFVDDPEGKYAAWEAKDDARKARHYRLRDVGVRPTQGRTGKTPTTGCAV